jgi:hypothetical protein
MPQEILDALSVKLLACLRVVHALVFKTNAVFDSSIMARRKPFRPLAHRYLERSLRDERVDYPATERLRRALERTHVYGAARLGLLEFHDPRLRDADASRELRRGHAQGIANGTNPAFGRTDTFGKGVQRGEACVEVVNGVFHMRRYILSIKKTQ